MQGNNNNLFRHLNLVTPPYLKNLDTTELELATGIYNTYDLGTLNSNDLEQKAGEIVDTAAWMEENLPTENSPKDIVDSGTYFKRQFNYPDALICYLVTMLMAFKDIFIRNDFKKTYCLNDIAECYMEIGHQENDQELKNQKFNMAENYFERSLNEDPEDYWTRYHYGLLLRRRNMNADARDQFNASLQLVMAAPQNNRNSEKLKAHRNHIAAVVNIVNQ